jgi:hypothetical protein
MQQRITLITLGVRDLGRARSFYEAIGWTGGEQPDEEVVFFQAGAMILGLWRRERLLEEAGLTDTGGTEAVSLAHNVGSREEVDAVIEEAERAGATIRRRPAPTDWGGYSALFADLDDHLWEVAHNPGWKLAEDGTISLH